TTTTTTTTTGAAIYIQAGAFANKNAAHRLKHDLTTLTDTPIQIVYQQQQIAGMQPTTLFKVQIGPLDDVKRAQLLTQLIQDTRLAIPFILSVPKAAEF
ncbi:MAG: SPOR domain-containing protein, partial [Pseudomonadales bacterium]|nr:SPOR domain-containing protein [Pseudomonadales bacterium]